MHFVDPVCKVLTLVEMAGTNTRHGHEREQCPVTHQNSRAGDHSPALLQEREDQAGEESCNRKALKHPHQADLLERGAEPAVIENAQYIKQ